MRNSEKRNLFLLPLLFVAAAVAGGLLWTTATRAMAAEGVKPPLPNTDLPKADGQAVAVFAGGCFWCEEAVFESFQGVGDVTSGFAGGKNADDATYAKVSSGGTGFAESVQVPYDPSKITYAKLLQIYFASIDPTTGNGQSPDFGTQYRPAVFYATPEQKKVVDDYVQQLDAAKIYDKPVAVHVEPLTKFYPAEDYHQNYVEHHPDETYVREVSMPKIKRVREQFKDLLKGADPAKSAGAGDESAAAKPWQVAVREEKVGDKVVKTEAEWKRALTPEQFEVLRKDGTETPRSSPLLDEHREGVFRCAACGLSLFESQTKFDSGTGWPSFFDYIPGHLAFTPDHTAGMERTELACPRCGGHLGHVFDDGPQPTGKRYCMDGVALKFQPADQIDTSKVAAAKAE